MSEERLNVYVFEMAMRAVRLVHLIVHANYPE